MSASVHQCPICLETIVSETNIPEEKEQKLNCSHVFHRLCIGEWLKKRHNCPLCRAHVEVSTPEEPTGGMTTEEILAVPDLLFQVRETVRTIRVSRINLNDNTPLALQARRINNFAVNFFNSLK